MAKPKSKPPSKPTAEWTSVPVGDYAESTRGTFERLTAAGVWSEAQAKLAEATRGDSSLAEREAQFRWLRTHYPPTGTSNGVPAKNAAGSSKPPITRLPQSQKRTESEATRSESNGERSLPYRPTEVRLPGPMPMRSTPPPTASSFPSAGPTASDSSIRLKRTSDESRPNSPPAGLAPSSTTSTGNHASPVGSIASPTSLTGSPSASSQNSPTVSKNASVGRPRTADRRAEADAAMSDEQRQSVADLRERTPAAFDKISDADWVYHHLAAYRAGLITADDAPSMGAWGLMLAAAEEPKAFYKDVFAKATKIKEREEERQNRIKDDGRTVFDLLDRLDPAGATA